MMTVAQSKSSDVSLALSEYNRRIGHQDSGVVTHFQWIDDKTFWIYQTTCNYPNMKLLMELTGQRSDESDRPEKFLKRRTITIAGDLSKDWHLIPVDQVDLTKLVPLNDRPDCLTIRRWHSVILFDLLSEIRDMALGGLTQRQIDAIARTIDNIPAQTRNDNQCLATVKDFLLSTPMERMNRRRYRKEMADSSLDNYPALLTEIFAGGEQPILASIVRESADLVYGC